MCVLFFSVASSPTLTGSPNGRVCVSLALSSPPRGWRTRPLGGPQSKRKLSQEEVANARKKVLSDLHLEGEYYVAGEEDQSNGHAGGGMGDGEDGVDGAGGENGYANGAVRKGCFFGRSWAGEASSVLSLQTGDAGP